MLANQDFKQADFKTRLYSPMEKLLAIDQVYYYKPISIVKQFFDFCMELRVQGEIRITPNYPYGWFAEVLSEDKVWTIECYRGEIRLGKVGDFVGYTQNGSYITTAEENICADIYYQQFCQYRDSEIEPIYCIDFCDNGDRDEFQCRCCPWVIID